MRDRTVAVLGMFVVVILILLWAPKRFPLRAAASFTKTGTTITVPEGGDLQAALAAASPGDTIVLSAGATYAGEFVLPAKTGHGVITIRGSESDHLPPENTRVGPKDAINMPKIVCPHCPAITAAPGAHDYRLRGIEIHPAEGRYADSLVQLGVFEKNTDRQPHDFEFDQMFLHGDPAKGTKRGLSLNAGRTVVRNSYFSDFKSDFQDSQAIAGWSGTGPYQIVNNYLEASGENLMFGGAAPSVPNLVPSNIEISYNYLSKPRIWKGVWRVKNLLEFKDAQHVRIRYNVLENNWEGAQSGFAVLFTVRSCEGGDIPWAVVKDVNFSYNILRHTSQGINILGRDDARGTCKMNPPVAGQTSDVQISNNLFEDLPDGGTAIQILSGAQRLTIDHNTMLQTGKVLVMAGPPSSEVIFRNNISPHNRYGIFGDSKGSGNNAINFYLRDSVITRNVIPGADPRSYPAGNFYPGSLNDVGFTNLADHIYSLAPSSKFRGKATDGKDPGADFDTVTRKTANVIKGVLPAEDIGENGLQRH
ncbi:MAG TPA: right-handed parallel beta-helix repeat-containing protein [Bryobacteraceae bacterium]|nr:right-handed parallel beta-helix repeat-containing protein [Bryobacteraceae bacterium]